MAAYVLRRVIQAIPILFFVGVLAFIIVHLAPGSPVDKFRGGRVSPEVIQNVIKLYQLDQPLPQQFWSWITTFPQVWRIEAWGYSFTDGKPVLRDIADKVPYTMLLMGSSLILTAIISIPLGVYAAVRQYSKSDKLITILATIGYAMPTFWLGFMLRTTFGVQFKMFPIFGALTLGSDFSVPDLLWHLFLPMTTITIVSVAGWSRYMRSSMLEVLRQDYVRTAKAKGLASSRVIFRHALRNAMIPIVTLFGLSLPVLLAGAAVTETVFSWPGLGYLTIQAVQTRDYPIVLAIVMLSGVMVIMGNLIADILYAVVDPRIKY